MMIPGPLGIQGRNTYFSLQKALIRVIVGKTDGVFVHFLFTLRPLFFKISIK